MRIEEYLLSLPPDDAKEFLEQHKKWNAIEIQAEEEWERHLKEMVPSCTGRLMSQPTKGLDIK